MREKFEVINFRTGTLKIIDQANNIIEEYQSQGYSLTLRQLYYQFVAKDLIPNTERSYKNLGNIINKGRLAGLIDWSSIEDRTRFTRGNTHWENPGHIVQACVNSFQLERWKEQDNYCEVWIEKDALRGVIEAVCDQWDVRYFSCRGYVSQSEMYSAAKRFMYKGQDHIGSCYLLHLGDHDPSGIDMTRDIRDRLSLFGADLEVIRIALNMDQIEEHGPPPNPAKITDSRYIEYKNKYGAESWELDSLPPNVITKLIEKEILSRLDKKEWDNTVSREDEYKKELGEFADNWEDKE